MSATKPVRLNRKNGLYLKDTGPKGRGVFCLYDIKKGEEIEITPAIILNETATGHVDKTHLQQYTFLVGKISKKFHKRIDMKSHANGSAVIMGLMTFCNHSHKPNAEIVWEEKNDTVYYTLQATRKIAKGEEICTSYGNGWFKDRFAKAH